MLWESANSCKILQYTQHKSRIEAPATYIYPNLNYYSLIAKISISGKTVYIHTAKVIPFKLLKLKQGLKNSVNCPDPIPTANVQIKRCARTNQKPIYSIVDTMENQLLILCPFKQQQCPQSYINLPRNKKQLNH